MWRRRLSRGEVLERSATRKQEEAVQSLIALADSRLLLANATGARRRPARWFYGRRRGRRLSQLRIDGATLSLGRTDPAIAALRGMITLTHSIHTQDVSLAFSRARPEPRPKARKVRKVGRKTKKLAKAGLQVRSQAPSDGEMTASEGAGSRDR